MDSLQELHTTFNLTKSIDSHVCMYCYKYGILRLQINITQVDIN